MAVEQHGFPPAPAYLVLRQPFSIEEAMICRCTYRARRGRSGHGLLLAWGGQV